MELDRLPTAAGPHMNRLLDEFLAVNDFEASTEEGYRWYGSRLDTLLGSVPLKDLTPQLFKSIRDREGWGDSHTRYFRNVAARLIRHFYGEDHPFLKLKLKKREPAHAKPLTLEDARAFLKAINPDSPVGRRDIAFALLSFDSGIRAKAVCELQIGGVDFNTRRWFVREKGGDVEMGGFTPYTAAFLEAWLTFRWAQPGVNNFFVSVQGRRKGTALTVRGLNDIVKAIAKRAGIEKMHTHRLRATFAAVAHKELGAPLRILMDAGHWSKLEDVQNYIGASRLDEFEPYYPTNILRRDAD